MARIHEQPDLPGVETPRDDEIEKQAKELYEVRSQRMSLSAQETTLADRLIATLREKKVKSYTCKGFPGIVQLKRGDDYRVKIKTVKPKKDKAKDKKKD